LCGIIGAVSKNGVAKMILKSLERLTYRGYDSSGIVTLNGTQRPYLLRRSGKINELLSAHEDSPCPGNIGLGHTRWATHGAPTEENAHPHFDTNKRYYVVCNGIIENYRSLKKQLMGKGYSFLSQTDTEVIPALLSQMESSLPMSDKIQKLTSLLTGSYALVVLDVETPGELWAARKGSPLLLARGNEGAYFGSDIPAVLGHAQEIYYLKDNEIAGITTDNLTLMDFQGRPLEATFEPLDFTLEEAQKDGYPHYMLKEIYEQADVVERTLKTYLVEDEIDFSSQLGNAFF